MLPLAEIMGECEVLLGSNVSLLRSCVATKLPVAPESNIA